MAYDNSKPFVAKSVDQMQKEYMETPFKLRNFYNGTQFTIVEDRLKKIPLRSKTELSHKTNKPYSVYLIKINDGYISKDLALFDEEVISLFRTLPESVVNIKNVTFANENGKWIFICQTDGNINAQAMPKSAEIANSMEPASEQQHVKTINDYAEMLAQAVKQNTTLGIITTYPILQKMADQIYPNRALDLIMAAKTKGCIADTGAEGYRGY